MSKADAPDSFCDEERDGLASSSDFTCDKSPERIASKKVAVSLMLPSPARQKRWWTRSRTLSGRSLATGAVFADRFIDEGVEFSARQGDFVRRIFTAVGRLRKFGTAARRRRNVIPGASRHQLGDLARREQLRLARQARGKRDLRKVFHGFQSEESRQQIRAAGDDAVVGKQKRIVVWDIRLKDRAEVRRARGGVADKRNLPEAHHDFRKKRLVKPLASGSESGSRRWMGMANGLNVRAHAIKQKVHAGFRRSLSLALQLAPFHVHDDKIIGIHHAFVEAGRSGQDAVAIEANRNISLARHDVAALVHPAANHANVAAVLFFRSGFQFR